MGIKGGFASATFLRSQPSAAPLPVGDSPFSSREGWTGGIFAVYPRTGLAAIQAEALYVMRGASLGKSLATNVDGDVIGEIESFHARDDVALTLLAKLMPAQGARVSPYVLLGPSLMQELRERLVISGAVDSSIRTADLRNADLTLTLGAGAETALGASRILLEVRYDRGMINLLDEKRTGGGPKLRTSTWRVMTGFAF